MNQSLRIIITLTAFASGFLEAQPNPSQMAAQNTQMHMQMHMQMQMQMMQMNAERWRQTLAKRAKAANLSAEQLKATMDQAWTEPPKKEIWRIAFNSKLDSFGMPDGDLLPVLRKTIIIPYRGAREVETFSIQVIDTRTGKAVWSQDLGKVEATIPQIEENTLLFSTPEFKVIALELSTGKQRFQADLERLKNFHLGGLNALVFPPITTADRLFVTTFGKGEQGQPSGNLYALDIRTGGRIWSQALVEGACESPLVFEDLVVAGRGSWVLGFSATDGKPVWKQYITDVKVSGPNFVVGNLVYFTGPSGVLALDARTGNKAWYSDAGGQHGRSLVLSDGENLFFVEYRIFGRSFARCLDAKTGRQAWEMNLGMDLGRNWSPCWAKDGIALFNKGEELLALNLNDGKECWRVVSPGSVPSFPMPVGNKILLTTIENNISKLRTLTLKDGKVAWSFQLPEKAGEFPVLSTNFGLFFFAKPDFLIGLQ